MEIENMTFEQFTDWAVGYFVMMIAHMTVRSIMWGILNTFVQQWLPSHGWRMSK